MFYSRIIHVVCDERARAHTHVCVCVSRGIIPHNTSSVNHLIKKWLRYDVLNSIMYTCMRSKSWTTSVEKKKVNHRLHSQNQINPSEYEKCNLKSKPICNPTTGFYYSQISAWKFASGCKNMFWKLPQPDSWTPLATNYSSSFLLIGATTVKGRSSWSWFSDMKQIIKSGLESGNRVHLSLLLSIDPCLTRFDFCPMIWTQTPTNYVARKHFANVHTPPIKLIWWI